MDDSKAVLSVDDFCHYLSGDAAWYFSAIKNTEAYPDIISAQTAETAAHVHRCH